MTITLNGTLGVTSPGFTPTSNTTPVSGFYLPSANTIGLVTGSTERVRIDSSGNVGIGTSSPGAGNTISIYKNITGATTSRGVFVNSTVQSDVTNYAFGVGTYLQTAATAFSTSISHYYANQGSVGAGSTISSQIGFHVESTLTGATNNYGFYSNISSGTGRYNFYANGTAVNYFAGNVGIGTNSPQAVLDVNGVIRSREEIHFCSGTTIKSRMGLGTYSGDATVLGIGTDNGTVNKLSLWTAGSERLRIDETGRVGIGTTSPIRLLTVSGYGSTEFVLQDTSQSANSKNWRMFVTGNTLKFGTLNDAGTSGTDMAYFNTNGFWNYGAGGFTHQLATGCGVRIGADTNNTRAVLQFTNVAQNVEWGAFLAATTDSMVWRTSTGSSTAYATVPFAINGGTLIVDRQTSSGGDIGDWPNPTLGLRNHDANFHARTMLLMGGRDDNVAYQTDATLWAWRLWNDAGTAGWTTSDGNTSLEWRGPGVLRIQAGGSNGVQLAKTATSWSAWSDERFKDIIEPISNASEKLLSIRSVIGKYKTDPDGTRRSMFIAQDFLDILPEAVTEGVHWGEIDPNDIKKQPTRSERYLLSYSDTIPLISAAVNENTNKIKELELIINELKNKIYLLQSQ